MLPGSFQLPAAVVLLVVGLLACVAGYRLLRAVLTIYGFVLGALFASSLVAPSDVPAMFVALAVGGVLGALALFAGYLAGVMLLGAGLGALAAQAVWTPWRGEPGALVVLACAAVGAALAAASQRYVVVVATAFVGAQTAVAGLAALLAGRVPRRLGLDDVWVAHLGAPRAGRQWTFLAWVALGVVGTFVQLRSPTPVRPRKK